MMNVSISGSKLSSIGGSVTMLILCLAFLMGSRDVYAQEALYGDYEWVLGPKSDQASDSISLKLSFVDEVRKFSRVSRPRTMDLMNASLSDEDGMLILYTNGCAIYDAENNVIPNGAGISPGYLHDSSCNGDYGHKIPDGVIFLPLSDTLIGLYHLGDTLINSPLFIYANRLLETLVRAKDGSFSVIRKNHVILRDSLSYGGIEAVRGYPVGGWIVLPRRADNEYFTLYIGSNGIEDIFSNVLGQQEFTDSGAGGQCCFSPDGMKYARYSIKSGIDIFNFDRNSGILSNNRHVTIPNENLFGGLAFSPNSRYLYASNLTELYQVDTEALDSTSQVFLVDTFDGFANPFHATFYRMQLAPDCKIYMIPNNGIATMHVINTPNDDGPHCGFVQHGITLPVPNSISIPNFPVSRVGNSEVACNSNIISVVAKPKDDNNLVNIYPNPSYGELTIESFSTEVFEIHIVDALGRIVYSKDKVDSTLNRFLNIELPAGVYFYIVRSNANTSATGKFVVIGRLY